MGGTGLSSKSVAHVLIMLNGEQHIKNVIFSKVNFEEGIGVSNAKFF